MVNCFLIYTMFGEGFFVILQQVIENKKVCFVIKFTFGYKFVFTLICQTVIVCSFQLINRYLLITMYMLCDYRDTKERKKSQGA